MCIWSLEDCNMEVLADGKEDRHIVEDRLVANILVDCDIELQL